MEERNQKTTRLASQYNNTNYTKLISSITPHCIFSIRNSPRLTHHHHLRRHHHPAASTIHMSKSKFTGFLHMSSYKAKEKQKSFRKYICAAWNELFQVSARGFILTIETLVVWYACTIVPILHMIFVLNQWRLIIILSFSPCWSVRGTLPIFLSVKVILRMQCERTCKNE